MIKKIIESYSGHLYFVFRVLVGFMFAQHGAQKLFGILGGSAAPLFSLMGLAGIIEFFGGIFIAIGLLTRMSALIAGLSMTAAWFMVHVPQGWIPIINGGELALMYLAAFLAVLAHGSGKWALDNMLNK